MDWSLLVSGVIFLVTLFALNRVLFRPMRDVSEARRERTSALFEKASENRQYSQALLDQYELKIREGRQAGYRQAEVVRSETLRLRQEKVKDARARAEALLRESRSSIEEEVEQAREGLRREAEKIASIISSRVLER